jgi:hypothetical protein
MKEIVERKWFIPLIITLLFGLGSVFIYKTLLDTSQIKENIHKKNSQLKNKLDSLSSEIDKSLEKNVVNGDSHLLRIQIYDLKKELDTSKSNQEETIDNLFLENLPNLMWIVGIFAMMVGLTGVEWRISAFVNNKIERVLDKRVNYIENVINSEVWLSDLRETAKLLVIYKEETTLDEGVRTVLDLTKLSYQKQALSELKADKLNLQGISAIFIEHAYSATELPWDKSYLENNLQSFAESFTDKGIAVFFYTNLGCRFPTLSKRNYLASFANAESNIYPNLKNLLIVQKLLSDQGQLTIGKA